MKMAGGCVAPQSRIDPDMLLRRALPAAHFDRNATTPVTDLVHQYQAISAPPRSAQQQCHPAPGDKKHLSHWSLDRIRKADEPEPYRLRPKFLSLQPTDIRFHHCHPAVSGLPSRSSAAPIPVENAALPMGDPKTGDAAGHPRFEFCSET